MPTAGDLCTLADVKSWLLITSTAEDALIERLIASCSSGIKAYVQRPLVSAAFDETYNGTGTQSLVLRNTPVTAIQALTVGGVEVQAASGPAGPGFLFDPTTVYLAGRGQTFPAGALNVRVQYTAGFASMPPAITQACVEYVAFKMNQRKHIGQKTANIQAGGMGTAYQEGDMPPEVVVAMARFRRRVPS